MWGARRLDVAAPWPRRERLSCVVRARRPRRLASAQVDVGEWMPYLVYLPRVGSVPIDQGGTPQPREIV
jgi:hypothetical protein